MSEAELCAAFIAAATAPPRRDEPQWIAYPETAGFDILLVRAADGVQIGIEAKLALNPRVLVQALPHRLTWFDPHKGPDYRAVLVPASKCSTDVRTLCDALGITVIEHRGGPGEGYHQENVRGPLFVPDLPIECHWRGRAQGWHEWAPTERCPVPDYVPDVAAGASAPVALTAWKVKAIKLVILLAERPVTRDDFKHLQLSPTLWLAPGGWLERTERGWIAGPRTPDLRRQHPRNFAEIEADKAKWAPAARPLLVASQAALL